MESIPSLLAPSIFKGIFQPAFHLAIKHMYVHLRISKLYFKLIYKSDDIMTSI
jgi:hypothetical protein